jgi:hypothetical protein
MHPYTPLAVGNLVDGIGVFHKLICILSQNKSIRAFNADFGTNYLFRASFRKSKDLETFGKPKI